MDLKVKSVFIYIGQVCTKEKLNNKICQKKAKQKINKEIKQSKAKEKKNMIVFLLYFVDIVR